MKFSLMLLTLVSALSFAALPPYPERTREIQMVLIDGKVEALVGDVKNLPSGSGVIDAVEFVSAKGKQHFYKVRSGKCSLDVTLLEKVTESVGPTSFELEVASQMQCAKK